MIPPKKFKKLRLKTLLPNKDIDNVFGFEYLGKVWFGETYIFSHALRLFTRPFSTRSIAISIEDLADSEIEHVSGLLGLDLNVLNNKSSCDKEFGEPHSIDEFVSDRKTYNYFSKDKKYELGFTILNTGNFIYFTANTIDVAYNQPFNK